MRKGASDMQIPKGTQRKPCILFSPKRYGFIFREKIWCSYFPQFQTFGKKSLSCRAFIEEELVNVRRLPPTSPPSPLYSFLMTINTRCHFPPSFPRSYRGKEGVSVAGHDPLLLLVRERLKEEILLKPQLAIFLIP